MINHHEIAGAVLKLWVRTGRPVVEAELSAHLGIPVLRTLNACGWHIDGLDFVMVGSFGALEPSKSTLRQYIKKLKG